MTVERSPPLASSERRLCSVMSALDAHATNLIPTGLINARATVQNL